MADKTLALLGLIILGISSIVSLAALTVNGSLGGDVESLLATVTVGCMTAIAALTHPNSATVTVVAPPAAPNDTATPNG